MSDAHKDSSRIQIIQEIAEAFIAWRTAAPPHTPYSPEARLAGGKAMKLLFRNITIVRQCAREPGTNYVTVSMLNDPALALEELSDDALEERGTWGYYKCICKDELIEDLERWHGREKPWDPSRKDFIPLTLASERYCTSGKAPKLSYLSVQCKPDGAFDYMRMRGLGVHVDEQQFAAWATEKGYTKEAVQKAQALLEAHKKSPVGLMDHLKEKWDTLWECPACGADLEGNTERCPKCGNTSLNRRTVKSHSKKRR